MARFKGVIISVKVPINWDIMTKRSRKRLRQIVGRDTRVIRAFLGIIEQHEARLLTGRNRDRIDNGKLDQLTMTAIRIKTGYNQRLLVPHDFKVRFPRISQNEIQECRMTAVALYESYLHLRKRTRRKASRPCVTHQSRRIPRWIFSQRFSLFEQKITIARWWLDLRDSLDSVPEGRRVHDRLLIPLKMSPFHLNQFKRGEAKAIQIFNDSSHKWWVTFAIRVKTPEPPNDFLHPAVLGIDLGIEKAACTTLVTPEKVRETRYFVQKDKMKNIRKYDRVIAQLQSEMTTLKNNGKPHDKVTLRLRSLKTKRQNIAREYDRVLVRQLTDYISKLSEKYTIYVALGRLKNIRNIARKGNYKGYKYRGMIHRWAFARITENLKHQLSQLGWTVDGKDSRIKIVSENWTSIICWKCGRKGKRPKQNYFVCPTCGQKTNADRNGAINIAGRLITLTKSLHSVRGLGKWVDSAKAVKRPQLKTREKKFKSSRRRSLLPSKGHVSHLGESAAVHFVQKDLLTFGDGSEKSDEDPVVEIDVENLSVAGSDMPVTRQENEARSAEGILSR